jgi:hypothetical protein
MPCMDETSGADLGDAFVECRKGHSVAAGCTEHLNGPKRRNPNSLVPSAATRLSSRHPPRDRNSGRRTSRTTDLTSDYEPRFHQTQNDVLGPL